MTLNPLFPGVNTVGGLQVCVSGNVQGLSLRVVAGPPDQSDKGSSRSPKKILLVSVFPQIQFLTTKTYATYINAPRNPHDGSRDDH